MNCSVERFRGYPVRRLDMRVAGERYVILGPDNYESLLDDPSVITRFERDEYMPYWAEFWPAALLLAEEVAQWTPDRTAGIMPTLLEFGCGLGLISLVALRRGFVVISSDYEDDALKFVEENARQNNLAAPQTRFIDWREEYPDLRPERIVAAEVLYEARNGEPIARFVATHLAPDGLAVICDRNRTTADCFPEQAQNVGLEVTVRHVETAVIGEREPVRGRLFELRHAASTALE